MKIAICDDNIIDIQRLRLHIIAHSTGHDVMEYSSVKAFLQRLHDGEQSDLLFLDVQMLDADGWEIARELKQSRDKVFIAMVTARDEYLYDCFDRVDWFVSKPISAEKVFHMLNSAQVQLNQEVLIFQVDKTQLSLAASEIIFLEIKRNTLYIHSTRGCFDVRLTLLKAKELLLHYKQFVQVHSSFIVNLDFYHQIDKSDITMKNKTVIGISRTYRASFLQALAEYKRELYG